jgi:5'-nucleotidase
VRILLVNDDGILAPGLRWLREAVADLGEVTVVAPETPQSAAGRSITLGAGVACRRVDVNGAFWGIGVSGRPADCVKLAVRELMPAPAELVLAGINAGANVGVNIFYSGTVAAAAEGALFGIPSVAFSLAGHTGPPGESDSTEDDFRRAGRLARWVLDALLAAPIRPGELVNVNIPAISHDGPRGVRVVPQSTSAINEYYLRGDAPDGRITFRLADYYHHGPEDGEMDVTALADGFITITPLRCDLTDRRRLAELAGRRWDDPPAGTQADE